MILTDGVSPITLPDDLLWDDEMWTPAEQAVAYSVTGAVIVESWHRAAGRPITLRNPRPDMAWKDVTRAKVMQLLAWAQADPPKQLLLTLEDLSNYTVIFRHPNPVEAVPVMGHTRRSDSEYWRLTLRLLEIA